VLKFWRGALVAAAIAGGATCASAQTSVTNDTRAQYPAFLSNSYFTLNVGSIRYLFGDQQLAPDFQSESVDVPHLGVRIDLFGHRFMKHLSAQVTYMRPARFVSFQNINGDLKKHQISQAYGGFTLVSDFRLTPKLSAYGEGGLGVTSRSGFVIDGQVAVQDAHFAAGILGAGLTYGVTPNMDLMFGATYSPGRKSFEQPSTRFYTTGLRYHMRPLPAAEVEDNLRAGYIFPENVIRLGYASNQLSYGVNNFFSETFPVFWGGNVQTRGGVTFDYQRNVFHTRKWFAFDLGASASYWASTENKEPFRTLSAYPLLRFFLLRAEPADLYLAYSVAGPTFISRTVIDGRETGEHFTFQDFMGIGGFIGQSRRFNAELGIKHYSNGNMFTRNASIKVPLTFSLGVTF